MRVLSRPVGHKLATCNERRTLIIGALGRDSEPGVLGVFGGLAKLDSTVYPARGKVLKKQRYRNPRRKVDPKGKDCLETSSGEECRALAPPMQVRSEISREEDLEGVMTARNADSNLSHFGNPTTASFRTCQCSVVLWGTTELLRAWTGLLSLAWVVRRRTS